MGDGSISQKASIGHASDEGGVSLSWSMKSIGECISDPRQSMYGIVTYIGGINWGI